MEARKLLAVRCYFELPPGPFTGLRNFLQCPLEKDSNYDQAIQYRRRA